MQCCNHRWIDIIKCKLPAVMLTFSTKAQGEKNVFIKKKIKNSEICKKQWKFKVLTWLPVLLVFSVESMHSLQQLPLLAAARVIDKVPGENLFQLADGQVFYRLLVVEIRQRGSDPPLCRWTDLQSTHSSRAVITYRATMIAFPLTLKIRTVRRCRCAQKRVSHLYETFRGL